MKVPAETARKLLAALASLPSTAPEPAGWLARVDRPWLRFSGRHVTDTGEDGCTVRLDAERLMTGRSQSIRVENLGQDAITIRLPALHGALRASLSNGQSSIHLECGGGSTDLYFEILAAASSEEIPKVLPLVAEADDIRTFSVRLRWDQDVRIGCFDFNGLPTPQRFDFGDIDPLADEPAASYRLRIGSLTPEPLRIRLKNLPSWLALDAAGLRRSGPLSGTFFDRPTPVDLTLSPRPLGALGPLRGVVRLETDDMRGEMRHFDLELAARFGSRRPRVRLVGVPALQVTRGDEYPLRLHLENLGIVPARLSVADKSPGISHGYPPEIPAAGSEPGCAVLELVVNTVGLEPGTYERFVEVAVEEGDPPRLRMSLRISVRNVAWPREIDFGSLEPGRPRQTVFLAQVDGAPLEPIVEPAPGAENFLTTRVLDGQRVQVICKPPAGCPPGSYDLRVHLRQPKIFFNGEVVIRVRVVRATRRLLGWAAAALLLLIILVVTLMLAFGTPSEMSANSAGGVDPRFSSILWRLSQYGQGTEGKAIRTVHHPPS